MSENYCNSLDCGFHLHALEKREVCGEEKCRKFSTHVVVCEMNSKISVSCGRGNVTVDEIVL